MVMPVVRCVQSDCHQFHAILFCCRYQTATAFSCESGFDADNIRALLQKSVVIHKYTHTIAVLHRNRMTIGRYDTGKIRIVERICRESCQIRRCGVMFGIVQSMGIGEMGIGQPEQMCFGVHHLCKFRNTAADRVGNGSRRIVRTFEHQGIEKIFQR